MAASSRRPSPNFLLGGAAYYYAQGVGSVTQAEYKVAPCSKSRSFRPIVNALRVSSTGTF